MTHSIQRRLMLGISLAILVVGLVGGLVSFWATYQEAYEFQDAQLVQIGAMFDAGHLPVPVKGEFRFKRQRSEDPQIFVQYLEDLDHDGVVDHHDDQIGFQVDLPDGLSDQTVNRQEFRTYVKTLAPGERIAIAQSAWVRDDVAWDNALRTVLPFLILIPVLLFVVADLIRKSFLPVSRLSREVEGRGDQELHAMPLAGVPSELTAFVRAINSLLTRVGQSLEVQRRFVADSAHELRSPMTAIALQAERLGQTDLSAEAKGRLVTLKNGINRSRQLLDQLLSLAREQSNGIERAAESSCSVMPVFRRVLGDLMPLAEARGIDLGVNQPEGSTLDAVVKASELDLTTILKNLVDNAIRYTPEGGRIDLGLELEEGFATLTVEDSGIGIEPELRHRVFDPFYRVLGSDQTGSGLGLSIVKTVVDRLGGHIELLDANAYPTGLCVRVRLQTVGRGSSMR